MRMPLVARGRQGLRWAIALAAVLALLQPALVAFDIELSGWRVDHGHLFTSASGALHDHDHPYDHDHSRGGHGETGTDADRDSDADSGVVFVSGDDVTSSVMPSSAVVADAPRLTPPLRAVLEGADTPSDVAIGPVAPPPRV